MHAAARTVPTSTTTSVDNPLGHAPCASSIVGTTTIDAAGAVVATDCANTS